MFNKVSSVANRTSDPRTAEIFVGLRINIQALIFLFIFFLLCNTVILYIFLRRIELNCGLFPVSVLSTCLLSQVMANERPIITSMPCSWSPLTTLPWWIWPVCCAPLTTAKRQRSGINGKLMNGSIQALRLGFRMVTGSRSNSKNMKHVRDWKKSRLYTAVVI